MGKARTYKNVKRWWRNLRVTSLSFPGQEKVLVMSAVGLSSMIVIVDGRAKEWAG
jgi:hypothetical protein